MLCAAKRLTVITSILAYLFVNTAAISEIWPGSPTTTMPLHLSEIVKNLLNNIERDGYWNENVDSALLFIEFLVKQKVQQQKSSVLDTAIGSLYLEILEKISSIRMKVIQSFGAHNLQAVFQHNLLITGFTLRRHQIDKNLEFKTMAQNYSTLLGTGFPNDTFAGLCLMHSQGLELCERLRRTCLPVIKISTPTYGFRRTHQALQLFFLMHHNCARFYGTRLSFEILATEHCSQVYREHQLIATLDSKEWQELYIEQSAICGLFGFAEFLNVEELTKIIDWESAATCGCIKSHLISDIQRNCRCTDHKHVILLVQFVNAMLFLI
ncbi:uncharacterized protein LOC120771724 [Bactrocera tryoni]|uniref:uncharacterized protein LOC120771724 n=1 Tax=Bactrocera tryoni TaxID=59916 RepID=UPI001A95E642|nr:uncharacterized protein LOC120771724 [Bactrocera tryoni]